MLSCDVPGKNTGFGIQLLQIKIKSYTRPYLCNPGKLILSFVFFFKQQNSNHEFNPKGQMWEMR